MNSSVSCLSQKIGDLFFIVFAHMQYIQKEANFSIVLKRYWNGKKAKCFAVTPYTVLRGGGISNAVTMNVTCRL